MPRPSSVQSACSRVNGASLDEAEAEEVLVVAGIPRVLFLAGRKRPVRIAAALRVQGMRVDVRAASEPGSFDGFDMIVLLPDAPAEQLEQYSAALAEFVGRRGGAAAQSVQ